jgi:Lustrin, cysteine-rich repeated domain
MLFRAKRIVSFCSNISLYNESKPLFCPTMDRDIRRHAETSSLLHDMVKRTIKCKDPQPSGSKMVDNSTAQMNYQASDFNLSDGRKQCNRNDQTSCPADHFCGFDSSASARICIRNPIEDGKQDCNLRGGTNDCPLGFECSSKPRAGNIKSAPGEVWGKCYRRPRAAGCMRDNKGHVIACP